MVAKGTFREDLYYRLRVVEIALPPLRERASDIPILVEGLLAKINRDLGKDVRYVTPAALAQLAAYAWPGNVRELENTLTRAVVLAKTDVLDETLLPIGATAQPPTPREADAEGALPTLREIERRHIARVLAHTEWNKRRACAILDISRPTLDRISLEREKQTLDLLTTTPISSLAIILGKLLSALSWVFLLLLASIPVTALVFTFGGVGPEDLVRSYVVLFATAIAFGSMGLFVSAFVKRTQAATVINLVTTIVVTAGATFLFVFWSTMTANGLLPNQPAQRDDSPISNLTRRPPEPLLYFNPFVAQLDVICGTETGFGGTCQIIAAVTDFDSVVNGNIGDQGFGIDHDTFWPRSVAAMLIAAVLLVILSVQMVAPTRRWRIRRHRPKAPPAPPVFEEIT